MKHVFVRPARITDREKCIDWLSKNPENGFDSDILSYKNTSVRCAFDSDGPLMFLPIQRPLMLESLGIRPDAKPSETAQAIKELFQDAVSQAYAEGSGEIYFLASEDSVPKFALEQTEFKEVKYKVYRLKIKDLECQKTPAEKCMKP